MKLLFLLIMATVAADTLTVQSPAFEHNGYIPERYSCKGANTSPALEVMGIPSSAKSLALIVDDPDATSGTFDHWVMWNIPVMERIEANTAPGIQGKNGRNENRYTGPCPPSGTHRYFFKVYALDTLIDLPAGSGKADLEQAMEGHILAAGELIGLFKK